MAVWRLVEGFGMYPVRTLHVHNSVEIGMCGRRPPCPSESTRRKKIQHRGGGGGAKSSFIAKEKKTRFEDPGPLLLRIAVSCTSQASH